MAGQVAEYISNDPITEWTSLESLISGFTFDQAKKYIIYSNGNDMIKVCASETTPTYFGTIVSPKSTIWYNKAKAGTLYIKGPKFNLAIGEV